MARTVTISMPREHTDSLVDELLALEGVLSLRRQDGASVQPAGDVVTVEVTDRASSRVVGLLTARGAGVDPRVSVTTSEPSGMMTASGADALASDIASTSFEEIEFMLDRQATLWSNETIVMGVAGMVAAAGLVTNAVHLVIGAMVITPGFVPLLKVSFSVAAGGAAWRRGLRQTAMGYGALVLGAAIAALVLQLSGRTLPAGADAYLSDGSLVSYWREVTAVGTLVAVVAALAGALIVNAGRGVLALGVMIALALVPGAALIGVGAVAGDLGLAVDGALRWAHDAIITVIVGVAAFAVLRWVRGRALHLTS